MAGNPVTERKTMMKIFYLSFILVFFILFSAFPDQLCSANELYRYKDKNGNWCFTNTPELVPNLNYMERIEKSDSGRSNSIDKEDLQKKYFNKSAPKNDIEKSRNATVAIKSAIGVGSGFFINNDGYILTNKHVVMADKRIIKKLQEMDDNLNNAKKQFDNEKQKIEQAKDHLNNIKNQRAYKEYKRKLTEWINDYEKRKKEYKDSIDKFYELKEKTDYPQDLSIFLVDGTELSVSFVSSSDDHDVALLKLHGYKTPFLEAGDTTKLIYGEPLYAIGSPSGLSLKHSVTSGVFSSAREFKEGPFTGESFIQTNAQINAGNSGGPLITENGKVIGINTWKFAGEKVEGLGFAIPIDTAIKEFEVYLRN